MRYAPSVAELLDQLRDAIERSGQTRYAISKATGIDQAQLSRLVSGEAGLGWDALKRLCDHLGVEIVVRPKRKGR